MTDEDHAVQISNLRMALNNAVARAEVAGLSIDVSVAPNGYITTSVERRTRILTPQEREDATNETRHRQRAGGGGWFLSDRDKA